MAMTLRTAIQSLDKVVRSSLIKTHKNIFIQNNCFSVERGGGNDLRKRMSFFQGAWNGWKYLTGQIPPTHRELIELQELRLALLSIHAGRLEEEYPDNPSLQEKELLDVWEDNKFLHNIGMRYEVQVGLVPEIIELFETFQQVDKQLESLEFSSLDMLLLQDYEETCLEQQNHSSLSSKNSYFLSTKRAALEILLRFIDNEENSSFTTETSSNSEKEKDDWCNKLDPLGYNGEGADQEVYKAIRGHQAYNLARSFLIKQQLGYSVIALKSSIPKAGRGIFLDGRAPAGAILAFFPGQVWPREYFMAPMPNELKEYFDYSNNPNLQLHFRGDDFCLDCRMSPYTVLRDSNPWAIAHIANHAPFDEAKARSVGINFFVKMQLSANNLHNYIPNEYAKPQTLMGGALLNRDKIDMHSMCLMNRRKEMVDEEILYDYHLAYFVPHLPEWYRYGQYNLNGIQDN
mmetsp:Transcript_22831/g.26023  ORF Transcript_22831/g.26023 Transcript_22831/m.26023 type:complete len:459 (-) Transcript_22831:63-1439(-)